MKLCIDDANVAKIRKIYEYFPVDGVSTNPSILAKTGRPPMKSSKRSVPSWATASCLSRQFPLMLREFAETHRIVKETGEGTLVKIPCAPEGFKAMKALKSEGIRFIGTAIYTPMQGILAAKCGAEYVAPYVNRIDNMGFDGIKVFLKKSMTPLPRTDWTTAVCWQQASRTQPAGAGPGQVRRKGGHRGSGCDRRPGEKCCH